MPRLRYHAGLAWFRCSHAVAVIPRAALWLALAVGVWPAAGQPPARVATTAERPVIRFGFSRQIFDSVNENDGRAALKMHAEAMGRAENVEIVVTEGMFDGADAANRALTAGTVDMMAMPTDEFLALSPALVTGPLIAVIIGGRPDDENLLVTRGDRGFDDIAALKGGHLLVLGGVKMPFSLIWLDVLALHAGLGPAERAFGEVTLTLKASKTVLPVFFGQADACVVSRKALQVMGELNPQILRQLRVLATSRPFVPSVMCFRAGMARDLIDRVVKAALTLHTTPSGRQLSIIFQSERMEVVSSASLDDARALVAEHDQLLAVYRQSVAPATGAANFSASN